MGNEYKDIDMINHKYYFFDYMINIKDFVKNGRKQRDNLEDY